MAHHKYTLAETGPKIEAFLHKILPLAGLQLTFTISEGETPHPDFENPDLMVRFQGSDVDMLLENKAELLLALEHVTMEAMVVSALRSAEIADLVKASRTPVREALSRLEQEGLVRRDGGWGYAVAEVSVRDVLELWSVRESLDTAVKNALPPRTSPPTTASSRVLISGCSMMRWSSRFRRSTMGRGSPLGPMMPAQVRASDRKSTRLNSSHIPLSRMPSSA